MKLQIENKLKSNTDFGIWLDSQEISDSEYRTIRNNFDKLLKDRLQLGFFVPCDLEGNVLNEEDFTDSEGYILDPICFNELKNAKSRVLFEGLNIENDMHHSTKRTTYYVDDVRVGINIEYHNGAKEFSFQMNHGHKIIEDLVKYNLTLTESAITKIKGV